jgi:hypothetical protein
MHSFSIGFVYMNSYLFFHSFHLFVRTLKNCCRMSEMKVFNFPSTSNSNTSTSNLVSCLIFVLAIIQLVILLLEPLIKMTQKYSNKLYKYCAILHAILCWKCDLLYINTIAQRKRFSFKSNKTILKKIGVKVIGPPCFQYSSTVPLWG